MSDEEWRPIPGWEGRYEVSSFGNVRNVNGQLRSVHLSDKGYGRVQLSSPRRQLFVHRLVALVFIPNPNKCLYVNHIDFVPSNNRADNLEWVTSAQNTRHSIKAGRIGHRFKIGTSSPTRRFSDDDVARMRELAKSGMTFTDISKEFKCDRTTARRAIVGEAHKHLGNPMDWKVATEAEDINDLLSKWKSRPVSIYTIELTLSTIRALVAERDNLRAALRSADDGGEG